MEKRDEDSVSDLKIVEDKQMDNLEDNLQGQVNGKNCIEFLYALSIQLSKKTSNRVVYQDQGFSIESYMYFLKKMNIATIHFLL